MHVFFFLNKLFIIMGNNYKIMIKIIQKNWNNRNQGEIEHPHKSLITKIEFCLKMAEKLTIIINSTNSKYVIIRAIFLALKNTFVSRDHQVTSTFFFIK